jgi:hypothetical protein
MRLPFRPAFFAAVLVLSCGAARGAPAPEEAVRILAPVPGAELRSGELAEIVWEPVGSGSPGFREWEAFVSFDGGESWPVRLTPHLPSGCTRAAFRVPESPTGRATLMLRVGDETDERELPLLEVVLRPGSGGRTRVEEAAPARGESARPGAAGTVVFAELSPSGRVVEKAHRIREDRWGGFHAGLFRRLAAKLRVRRDLRSAPPEQPPAAGTAAPIPAPEPERAGASRASADLLARHRRRNV